MSQQHLEGFAYQEEEAKFGSLVAQTRVRVLSLRILFISLCCRELFCISRQQSLFVCDKVSIMTVTATATTTTSLHWPTANTLGGQLSFKYLLVLVLVLPLTTFPQTIKVSFNNSAVSSSRISSHLPLLLIQIQIPIQLGDN